MPAAAEAPVRVWDLPTRVFHWALALAVTGSVVSAKIGGNAVVWHFRFGAAVLALLLFRLVWGLIGGRWSRFASFIYAPGTLLRYLRGRAGPDELLDVGHSPLGSLSVFALLGALALQLATGLVADDGIASVGPLNQFVSSATAGTATGWHKNVGQYLLLGLVALHIAAIVYHTVVHRHPLVGPMIGGDKPLPAGTPASRDNLGTRGLALLLAAACSGLAAWVLQLGH